MAVSADAFVTDDGEAGKNFNDGTTLIFGSGLIAYLRLNPVELSKTGVSKALISVIYSKNRDAQNTLLTETSGHLTEDEQPTHILWTPENITFNTCPQDPEDAWENHMP
ncbi:hypothetical protein [Coriobacterium glomerans]|uniref:hypothetical protein n=1 Tax=Coriobacterium glomerans TaxID=33871 RepID=UPI00031B9FF2|nr:hypothetical protein [Coriobacterium glomerans]